MIKMLKKIIHMMDKYKKRLYFGIILSMVNNILGVVPIMAGVYTIKIILDDMNGISKVKTSYIYVLIAVIVGSILVRWLFAYLRAIKQDSIAHEVTCEERLKIGDIFKRVSLGFLQKKILVK